MFQSIAGTEAANRSFGIEVARLAGLPPEVVLFTLYARACDPVLPLLKAETRFQPLWVADLDGCSR